MKANVCDLCGKVVLQSDYYSEQIIFSQLFVHENKLSDAIEICPECTKMLVDQARKIRDGDVE